MLERGDLRLLLSAPGPGPGGGQSTAGGMEPRPGGWNRFGLEAEDLAAEVDALRAAGCRFRSEIVEGSGAGR
jgi:hypothetical protein